MIDISRRVVYLRVTRSVTKPVTIASEGDWMRDSWRCWHCCLISSPSPRRYVVQPKTLPARLCCYDLFNSLLRLNNLWSFFAVFFSLKCADLLQLSRLRCDLFVELNFVDRQSCALRWHCCFIIVQLHVVHCTCTCTCHFFSFFVAVKCYVTLRNLLNSC